MAFCCLIGLVPLRMMMLVLVYSMEVCMYPTKKGSGSCEEVRRPRMC